MNEQQQAELLATWLADPNASIPEELDAEVVESVLALHPERAPAPRVTAASILRLVESGPLAAPRMPNAVVQPPPTPSPANRPWALLIGLVGGSGAVVAALTMLTVGVVVSQNTDMTTAERPLQNTSRSHQRDTGLVGQAPAAKAPAKRYRPSPRPRPQRVKGGAPPAQQKALELAARPIPAEPAVVSLDDFEDSIIESDAAGIDLDAARLDAPLAGAAPPAPPPQETADGFGEQVIAESEESKKSEARAAASAKEGRGSTAERVLDEDRRRAEEAQARAAAQADEEASRRRADEAPADVLEQPALEREQLSRGSRRKSKKDRRPRHAREPIAEMPAAAPIAVQPSPPISPYAGTSAVSDPQVTTAQQALAAGDAAAAIAAANAGLQSHPGNTRVRQLLYAVLGDAYTTMGNTTAANQAYAEATRIAYSLR